MERPGFPPNPPVDHVDFEEHAVLVAEALGDGAHLVGHSYGGVVSLLAAAAAPGRMLSLTVIEPPAMAVARGNPAADAFTREGIAWWRDGPTDDPEAFLRGFLAFVGSEYEPPSPLPPALEQGARTLIVERGPWEAEIPLDELAAAGIPALVVSGAHNAGVRRGLRRARGAARRRAARAARLRAHGAAASGVQRARWRSSCCGRTRPGRPAEAGHRRATPTAAAPRRGASSRRRTRGFPSLTISSR